MAKLFFDQMDLNKDGVIDYEEWAKGCQVMSDDAAKVSAKFHNLNLEIMGVLAERKVT